MVTLLKSKVQNQFWTRMTVIVLVALTLLRFWLGIKTPILLQASAGYDDYLYVEYASSMLRGEWLGGFSHFTLLKAVSPAVILAVNYILGISYSLSMTVGYILAVFIFSLAMYRLMESRKFFVSLYVFLLYSPGMFHEENVQKVYRGGYIVIFTLLVFAAVIGQHAAVIRERKREFVFWTILGCVSLPVFYYLKEDSIWILPFVCVGMLVTLAALWRRKHTWRQLKLVAVLSPLFVLMAVTIGYKTLNYCYYGEYAVTDRSDTYCKEVLSDLLKVDDGVNNEQQNIWVTRSMIDTAAKHSETLRQLLPYIEESWTRWFGEGKEAGGDFYIWAFRDAVRLAGIYDGGGANVNRYYQKLHMELQEAYDSGELDELSDRIYISPVTRGFTFEELVEYYGARLPHIAKILAAYKENITTARESSGSSENLAIMSALTSSHFRQGGVDNQYYRYDEKIAAIDNKITAVYQKTGYLMFFSSSVGIAAMFVLTVLKIIRKTVSEKEVSVLLVTAGIAASGVLVVFAVTWFCNFLSDRKVYDYLCAAIPLMETVEIIGLYYLVIYIRRGVQKIRGGKEK